MVKPHFQLQKELICDQQQQNQQSKQADFHRGNSTGTIIPGIGMNGNGINPIIKSSVNDRLKRSFSNNESRDTQNQHISVNN